MENIYTAKTLEEAKEQAYSEFAAQGADRDDIDFEVLEQPVKKLFGVKGQYKVKAVWNKTETAASAAAPQAPEAEAETTAEASSDAVNCEKVKRAVAYLNKLLAQLGVTNFNINPIEKNGTVVLDIVGDNLGVIIGRRGETLDALQYLTILASNRGEDSYCRISVDCCGYREKRKDALEALAAKTANKVLKNGRRITLEPMNPYERRIIHSKIAEIEGVSSHSTGEEPFRKVVISSNTRKEGTREGGRDNRRRGSRQSYNGRNYKQSGGFSTSFEREYKRTAAAPIEPTEYSEETMDFEKDATLYGKIEL